MDIKALFNYFFLVAINTHLFVSSTPTISSTNVFHSKLYSNLSLTFKSPQLCDETVQQYSGYIDVSENEHYFFWFFESRQQPDKDPLTVWINGGPGTSSMLGLWMEIGPCFTNEDGTKAFYNERGSWNQVSNLLFFDQPSGTGFSYTTTSDVFTTDQAIPLVDIFLQIFFEAFPKYQKSDLHFFGESFAGHFVPSMADYILKQNQLNNPNRISVNLKSIGLGAAVTNPYIQNQYFEKMACNSTYGSILPSPVCDVMKKNLPICSQLTEKCYETDNGQDCIAASYYCMLSIENMITISGRYPFDIRLTELAFPFENYLNQPSIIEAIGARKPYITLNAEVRNNFLASGDRIKSRAPQVANLLNDGIQVLAFAGDADYACHWYGIHAWTNQLAFNGDHLYRQDVLNPWIVDGKEVGQIQQGGKMTFIKFNDSGHLVPFYHPELALKMFTDHLNRCSH
ncbi:Alpha/Beta hydrolase protein [Cunninghamella echinulata]|nr:Alpha/Beta hydrolase protein [Cunninghamella echinulata]